jgi:histidine phosphotransferase ChpT
MNDLDLAELLCARLCHDLISPVGAIGNGLELVLAEPNVSVDDLRLIDSSARAAQAALAFYRIAFGLRGDNGTLIGPAALADVVHAHFGKGRLSIEMPRVGPDLPRPVAKATLLMLLCGASAAPVGGQMVLATPRLEPLSLTLAVQGRRVGFQPAALALVTGAVRTAPEAPREAHLALLPRLASCIGAHVVAEQGGPEAEARLTLRVVGN